MNLCNINRKKYKFIYSFRQHFAVKICYNKLRGGQAMEEVKKLELMIKNNSRYEEIIEQSKKIDEYIKNKIEGAL